MSEWSTWLFMSVAIAMSVSIGGCARTNEGPAVIDDELTQAVVENGARAGLHLGADTAECAAKSIRADFDRSTLASWGVDGDASTPVALSEPPLTKSQADQLFMLLDDCHNLVQDLAAAFADDRSVTSGQARCAADRFIQSGASRTAFFQRTESPDSDPVTLAKINALADCQGASS